jgi:acylphosphatase
MTVCKRIQYCGRVQGVGFRYSARQLAEEFVVAGYVRNLRNGDVELVAEGAQDEVDRFLDAIASQMAGYIQKTCTQDLPPEGLQGFQIRF